MLLSEMNGGGDGAGDLSVTGYRHPRYAASLAEFGQPHHLPGCDGWILVRSIADSPHRDAIGPYPLFSCRDWKGLAADIHSLRQDLVSIGLVADPFAHDASQFAECFDLVIPFKQHYVVDLEQPPASFVSPHHRYYGRRALKRLAIEVCCDPIQFAAEWSRVYQNLIRRHGITGISAFSPQSFAIQMSVPGLVALKACDGGSVVGAHLWYVQGDIAYSHLAAATDRGYQSRCLYATYAFALDYFKGRVRWLDLGAGAGTSAKHDGLTLFKADWATGTRTAYFCGSVLDRERYADLVDRTGTQESVYFPAYRTGEPY